MQTNFLPFAVKYSYFHFQLGQKWKQQKQRHNKNGGGCGNKTTTKVAAPARQKKHPFLTKSPGIWPKTSRHSHWHFGRRKGKERCKQKTNKILVIGRQREKTPLIFWPVSALVTYSWLILLAKKRVLSQTDAAWGTRVTFDLRLDCTGYHQLVSCCWCWKYSSYLHGVVAFSFILLLDKYLMRFTVGFFIHQSLSQSQSHAWSIIFHMAGSALWQHQLAVQCHRRNGSVVAVSLAKTCSGTLRRVFHTVARTQSPMPRNTHSETIEKCRLKPCSKTNIRRGDAATNFWSFSFPFPFPLPTTCWQKKNQLASWAMEAGFWMEFNPVCFLLSRWLADSR